MDNKETCSYCGADCRNCPSKEGCRGCLATCGSPFGGRCVAAEYIKVGGKEAYEEFKKSLCDEVNAILASLGIGPADRLYELVGEYVNLEYETPCGGKVKFLDDKNVYLGAQIEFADRGVCCGVVADAGFILVCGYGVDSSDPELILYKKR